MNFVHEDDSIHLMDILRSINGESHSTPYYLNSIPDSNTATNLREGYEGKRLLYHP
jgi:hypothetical protein